MVNICKYKEKFINVVIFVSCLMTLQGCASFSGGVKPIDLSEPVQIQLKGAAGESQTTRFYSHSLSKNFFEGQITKQKDEIVEFSLIERISKVTSAGHLVVQATTKDKDGMIDLHDMAFPEEGELIEYIYSSDAKVLKAGSYPKQSIFYVPPIPLPSTKVDIGDTWEMTKEWISLKNGVPLMVSLIGILKNVYPCGEFRCADIEISGDVTVANIAKVEMDFASNIHGRMLFNLEKGTIVWSEIQSEEDLRTEQARAVVKSCLVSHMIEPEELKWLEKSISDLKCEPTGGVIDKVPNTRN